MRAPRALAALLLLAATAPAGEMERGILDAHGLSPDTASLSGHLRPLRPTEGERRTAEELVASLASDSPAERRRAVQWLGARTGPPLAALKAATASADPDVRRVGEELLAEALHRVDKEVLRAVLRTAADERVTGLAEDLLGIAMLAADLRMEAELAGALRATLREADLPLLREAAHADDRHARRVAIRALGAAPGAGPDDVAAYAVAEDEHLRLAAALAFADRGDRRCLPLLGSLLDAEESRVRRDAAEALRLVRGPGARYDPFTAPEARRAAAAAWRARIAEQGDDQPWEYPLPISRHLLGRTLVALYHEGRVVELDAAQRIIFEVTGLQYPWAVQGLPDGRRLVLLHPGILVEYTEAGQEFSRMALPQGWPGNFQRLENGHTLLTMMNPNRIVEMDARGNVVAEIQTPDTPFDVQRLDNGNLLVCMLRMPRVVELDREGRVRWSLGGLKNPLCARRIANGNTLVADTGAGGGRIAEYDREGRIVWERTGYRNCYTLDRLPDGSTLVADVSGVREIAPDGTERWVLHATQGPVRASRY